MILDTLRDIAIALSLCVLIPLTLMYGIHVFFPEPRMVWTDEYNRLENEVDAIRKERDQMVYDRDMIANKKLEEYKAHLSDEKIKELDARSEAKQKEINAVSAPLRKQHEDAVNAQRRLIMILSASIGFVLILIGLFFPASAIGAGLLFGGTGCMVYTYMSHFRLFSEKMNFFILLAAILLVIVIGYWFFKRQQAK